MGQIGSTVFHLLPYGVSVAISAGVAIACAHRRHEMGATAYALVALSQASWTFGYIFELASPTLAGKIWWDNFQFIGMAGWAVGMIAFTLTFTGRPPVRAWLTAVLASLPLLALPVLAYTDPWHHLIRHRAYLVPGEPFSMLLYDLTAPVWACGIYAYGCFVLMSGILTAKYLRAHRLYRRQVGLVLAGNLVPILGSFATLTVLRDNPERDLTPLTFAVGNLLVALGLSRYQLFDVVPVARDMVIEAINDAVFVLDPQDRIVDLNPTARQLLGAHAAGPVGRAAADVVPGWPALLGYRQRHLTDPAVPDAHHAPDRGAGHASEHAHLEAEEFRLELPYDGDHCAELNSYTIPDLRGQVRGRVVLWRDVTQRKRMEEELQKMEAVGRMAGGLAHDFSNLLQVLKLNLDGLAVRVPEITRTEEYTDIGLELGRTAQLIHHLLLFSRRQTLEPQVLDLNAVIEQSLSLIRRAVEPGVRLDTILDRGLWPVYADAVQLEQVLLNLAINARDAMSEGGKLVFRTWCLTITDGQAIDAELNPGDYVVLAVSDTGHGMDAETQAQVFDAFFTTKAPDKGTGLGLSTVYGIVAQSGGTIRVASTPGAGTTFTIYLPRAETALAELGMNAHAVRP